MKFYRRCCCYFCSEPGAVVCSEKELWQEKTRFAFEGQSLRSGCRMIYSRSARCEVWVPAWFGPGFRSSAQIVTFCVSPRKISKGSKSTVSLCLKAYLIHGALKVVGLVERSLQRSLTASHTLNYCLTSEEATGDSPHEMVSQKGPCWLMSSKRSIMNRLNSPCSSTAFLGQQTTWSQFGWLQTSLVSIQGQPLLQSRPLNFRETGLENCLHLASLVFSYLKTFLLLIFELYFEKSHSSLKAGWTQGLF